MASELVPSYFALVEVNASFRWFSQRSQTRFGTSGELLIHEKKKKNNNNNINSRKKLVQLILQISLW